nr:vesicle transport protein GOT1-like [Ipomoea trifida]
MFIFICNSSYCSPAAASSSTKAKEKPFFLLLQFQILFFSGVALTIGLKSSMQFFTKRTNFKGTMSFGAGFFLVVIGWPILGMILEAYGFIILFSGFWPTLAVFLQKIPILGWLLQHPFVRSILFESNTSIVSIEL